MNPIAAQRRPRARRVIVDRTNYLGSLFFHGYTNTGDERWSLSVPRGAGGPDALHRLSSKPNGNDHPEALLDSPRSARADAADVGCTECARGGRPDNAAWTV